MTCRRSSGPSVSSTPSSFRTSNKTATKPAAFFAIFLLSAACFAQDLPQANDQSADQARDIQPAPASATVTVPAGTRLALVLTHPVESRVLHRGDDIYAQTSSPVDSGNEVVIPAGTFVRGVVDKLGRNGGRGELRLQSMSIIFPDGYVASVAGPITLESNEGYAIKDPGAGRAVAALALPAAGAGLGSLIGHSVGNADSTVTTMLPPGCITPSPFCLTTSTPVFGTKGKDAIIGAGIGSAIGAIASMTLLFGSHHFFLDTWSPVELVLQQPVTLERNEVSEAVRESEEHPTPQPPTATRVQPPPPPNTPVDHGTCYTPDTPGTPSTIIPGPPGPDGSPGPPTTIPGTPPIPGTPYPCP